MEELDLAEKLGTLGYDYEQKVKGTPIDVANICRGHLKGLILLNGRVEAHSGFSTVLEDAHLYAAYSKVGDQGALYISPLQKRIKEEYIRVGGIQISDYIEVLPERVVSNLDSFSLVIKDAREHLVARIEFFKREHEMLYVPKK